MTYTVRELITNAFYLSGVVARGLETITGEQITDGYQLLNSLLAIKTAKNRMIPYFTQYDFTAIPGESTYFIANLIEAETLVFYISDVRYQTRPTSRKKFFGTSRAENVQTLPFEWHLERCKGGSRIYLYFVPNAAYPLTLWGKFGLSQVESLEQDLQLIYDLFYIEYMRYALAEYICSEYNITFQPQSLQKLREYEEVITDTSPIDFSTQKVSMLQRDVGLNYGDINIGRGYRP